MPRDYTSSQLTRDVYMLSPRFIKTIYPNYLSGETTVFTGSVQKIHLLRLVPHLLNDPYNGHRSLHTVCIQPILLLSYLPSSIWLIGRLMRTWKWRRYLWEAAEQKMIFFIDGLSLRLFVLSDHVRIWNLLICSCLD